MIDPLTGEIRRKITADPTLFAIQVGTGESLFALVDDDGLHIDDGNLLVSEMGEWEAKEGAPEGLTLPVATIEYVAV
ncbi:hypothetical protein [Phenylobacterium sp.]|uniref:hypothetical protein n=1 Tax=Phenylobacterium sp. TaxID=1871053 RepID=UPI002810D4DD|nr:hypothetical protein [Phenylobacterium sp.]